MLWAVARTVERLRRKGRARTKVSVRRLLRQMRISPWSNSGRAREGRTFQYNFQEDPMRSLVRRSPSEIQRWERQMMNTLVNTVL